MTVEELIFELQSIPGDAIVQRRTYEDRESVDYDLTAIHIVRTKGDDGKMKTAKIVLL